MLNIKISIKIIWLIHISGALGTFIFDIIFFAALTPINLYLTALSRPNKWFREVFNHSYFFIGIFVELLGVHYLNFWKL